MGHKIRGVRSPDFCSCHRRDGSELVLFLKTKCGLIGAMRVPSLQVLSLRTNQSWVSFPPHAPLLRRLVGSSGLAFLPCVNRVGAENLRLRRSRIALRGGKSYWRSWDQVGSEFSPSFPSSANQRGECVNEPVVKKMTCNFFGRSFCFWSLQRGSGFRLRP